MAMLKPAFILLFVTLLPGYYATNFVTDQEQRLIQMQMDFQRRIEAEYQVIKLLFFV